MGLMERTKRQTAPGGAIALVALLCGCVGGCVATEQDGAGVALMRTVMIESAQAGEGRKPVKSAEQAIRAVRDWRRAQQGG